MIKVIKHGDSLRTYECPECGCVFIMDKISYKDHMFKIKCPECEAIIDKNNYMEFKTYANDVLTKMVNTPLCWQEGEYDNSSEAINTSATTEDCIKR